MAVVQMDLSKVRAQLSSLVKGNDTIQVMVRGKVVATLLPGSVPVSTRTADQVPVTTRTNDAPSVQLVPAPDVAPVDATPPPGASRSAPYDTPQVRALLNRAFPRRK